MSCTVSSEQPDLVFNEIGNDAHISFQDLENEPESADKGKYSKVYKEISKTDPDFEFMDNQDKCRHLKGKQARQPDPWSEWPVR